MTALPLADVADEDRPPGGIVVGQTRLNRPTLMPKPEICASCGQEVRWGWRDGVETWLHRESVDHNPIFGRRLGPEDFARIEATRARYAEEEEETPDNTTIPPPEVWATTIDLGDPRLPNGAKDRIKQARKAGWTAVARYSRGPRTHALLGTFLGVSDYLRVHFTLDGTDRRAIASWKDGKFDYAFVRAADHQTKAFHTRRANSDGLKAWIEGEDT